jgi:uncharacterized membrane protein YhaH (DUF805 family)
MGIPVPRVSAEPELNTSNRFWDICYLHYNKENRKQKIKLAVGQEITCFYFYVALFAPIIPILNMRSGRFHDLQIAHIFTLVLNVATYMLPALDFEISFLLRCC